MIKTLRAENASPPLVMAYMIMNLMVAGVLLLTSMSKCFMKKLVNSSSYLIFKATLMRSKLLRFTIYDSKASISYSFAATFRRVC